MYGVSTRLVYRLKYIYIYIEMQITNVNWVHVLIISFMINLAYACYPFFFFFCLALFCFCSFFFFAFILPYEVSLLRYFALGIFSSADQSDDWFGFELVGWLAGWQSDWLYSRFTYLQPFRVKVEMFALIRDHPKNM